MKKNFLVVVCATVISIFPLLCSAEGNPAFNFEKMLETLEKAYPVVEKQSLLLIKMLDHDKFRERMKTEADSGDPLKDSIIYKTFKKYEVPFKESFVNLNTFSPRREISGNRYFPLLNINDIYSIAFGTFYGSGTDRTYGFNKADLTDRNIARLRENILNFLDALEPLDMKYKESIKNSDNYSMWTTFRPSSLEESAMSNFYSNLTSTETSKTLDILSYTDEMTSYQAERLKELPNQYIDFIVELAKRLESMGYIPVAYNGHTSTYSQFYNCVEKLKEEKALMEDLDDIELLSSGSDSSQVPTNERTGFPIEGETNLDKSSNDLSIDDLDL